MEVIVVVAGVRRHPLLAPIISLSTILVSDQIIYSSLLPSLIQPRHIIAAPAFSTLDAS